MFCLLFLKSNVSKNIVLGFCCAYLIFITENMSHYFLTATPSSSDVNMTENKENDENNSFIQRYILFIMLLPLCLLCFLRHLDKLAMFRCAML